MSSSDAYLAAVRDRLVQDGCTVTEGRVHTFRGGRLWGAALAGHLRQKSTLYLPDPA